ncbi:phosphoadenosine phosphosulfate reductase family protein, partial [Chromohalobacter israelensis]|uniref:phosphoadenosine phosphosulfate reductase domain-containing protein n=1 Tax=Chromohalobacter israelensis TaxID=141390 RepID=UPI003AF4DE7D
MTEITPERQTHLKQLEAESIHIIREVAAEFANPVMLYSIGKDSSVMLHLARKAFYPGTPPFPLMHVNTTWKFKEMIEFRDRMAAEVGMELIEHINEEGRAAGINPFREVAAEFANPVMLYSIGKDSSVMLHLARKAFYPGTPPFPLMHVNTTWKFKEMIEFRDRMAAEVGMELIEHINEEGRAAGINP